MKALRGLGIGWLVLVLIFLLGPTLVVLVDSINSATSFPSPFEQATLRWYRALGEHEEFLDAAINSVEIALASSAIATLCAFLGGFALSRRRVRFGHAISTAMLSPLFIPEIVIGLAILQVLGLVALPLSMLTLIVAHAVFVLPMALRLTLSGFSRFDFGLLDAARSLGANPARAMLAVTLPILRPSLIAGFTLSAVFSFVNLPLSMFLTTPRTATLPVVVFAYMESRIDPMIAALATLVVLIAAAATIGVDRFLRIRILD